MIWEKKEEEKRPAGIIVVRAHGGGGAAATHGVLIIGIGFRRGKTRFRMHELGTWNVIIVVVVDIVVVLAKHDVPLFSLSFTMFCSSFTDQATKEHSATTVKQNHKERKEKRKKEITEEGKRWRLWLIGFMLVGQERSEEIKEYENCIEGGRGERVENYICMCVVESWNERYTWFGESCIDTYDKLLIYGIYGFFLVKYRNIALLLLGLRMFGMVSC